MSILGRVLAKSLNLSHKLFAIGVFWCFVDEGKQGLEKNVKG